MAHGTGEGFPTTDWALLSRARGGAAGDASAPFGELLGRYVPAMRRYLRRVKRFSSERADDLVQSFVADKLLDRGLLQSADQQRGKFRNLLLRSLENYLIDLHRRARSHRPGGEITVSRSDFGRCADDDSADLLRAFEVEWAKSVIQEAIVRTYRHCAQRNRLELWQALQCRIVDPAADGTRPPSYRELVQRFGYATPAQAANALFSAKRLFIRMLNQVLVEQSAADADLTEELTHLRKIISQGAKFSRRLRKQG